MPRVAGRSSLFAPAVNVRHGVGAALDVGAAQEGPAVVAYLLYPIKYQVGFSVEGGNKENKSITIVSALFFS